MTLMNADRKAYYALLGVVPGVAAEGITTAFRRRARIVHPDVPGTGDAASFVALKAAYDVLADPSRRAAYDEVRAFQSADHPTSGALEPRRHRDFAGSICRWSSGGRCSACRRSWQWR